MALELHAKTRRSGQEALGTRTFLFLGLEPIKSNSALRLPWEVTGLTPGERTVELPSHLSYSLFKLQNSCSSQLPFPEKGEVSGCHRGEDGLGPQGDRGGAPTFRWMRG